MVEESKTLRHTAEEIDDAIDKLPADGNAAGVYKSSLSFSAIVNDGNVTQEQITEISAIYTAWKAGKMVYVVDERGTYFNLGILNMQIADDNTEVSFVVFDQSRQLCVFRCDPSMPQDRWSVYPVGKDLFALIQHAHTASDVTEETNKRFMTDAERTKLDGIDLSLYAKADLSNAMTVSLNQNGYAKFNNGLLIQFGFISTTGRERTVYLPVSFYDTTYHVFPAPEAPSDINVVETLYLSYKATSNFRIKGSFVNPANNNEYGYPGEAFHWLAIGRWK